MKRFSTEGPVVLWEKMKGSLGELKNKIMTEVLNWVKKTIVFKAMLKLAGMLNPVGALIQAAIAIYNTVMFFVERWTQIKSFVSSIFNSIGNIAFGKIKGAAGYIEKAMAKGLTLLISFLARFIGLGGISKQIRKVINKIRKPIDKVLDKIINWLVRKGKALLAKGKSAVKKGLEKGKAGIRSIIEWWKKKKTFKTKKGKAHKIFFKGNGLNAKLMVASQESTIENLLNSADVKKLENRDDGKTHISALRKFLDKTNADLRDIVKAMVKHDEKAANEVSLEIDKDLENLVTEIRWVLENIGDAEYPKVETYEKLSRVAGFARHHVPPKALANWISKQVLLVDETILNEFPNIKEAAKKAEKEHKDGGPKLSSILIHSETHITKSKENPELHGFRVHHGKETSEIVGEILKGKGIEPIKKNTKVLTDSDLVRQLLESQEANETDPTPEGKPSTQFYLKELDLAKKEVKRKSKSQIPKYIDSVKNVFHRVYKQSFTAVSVGLKASLGRDGTPSSQNEALKKLGVDAKTTWENVDPGMKELTKF